MALEWFISAVVTAVGASVFGQFEAGSSPRRRVLRWGQYYAITALIGRTAGRPWTFVWVAGLPLTGMAFHVWWCRKNGIDPWTAEPRERYNELRGWGTPRGQRS